MHTSRKLKLGYLALAGVDAWLSGSTRSAAHRARALTKPLLMPVLAASLATNPRARRSPLRTTTLAAQAFGWGGDVALLREGTRAFTAGAGSFGVGHASYLTGFVKHRNQEQPLLQRRTTKLLAGTAILSAPALVLGAQRHDPRLVPAVAGYSAVLTTMVATAQNLDRSVPTTSRRLTALGALMFLVSDTVLGMRKFVLSDPPARMESVVMATYTAAQFLLSEGAARA